MTDPQSLLDFHEVAREVARGLVDLALGGVFTWMAGRVRRAIRDLNCYFARSRAMETCILESSSFDDFRARVKAEVDTRELHQRRERNGPG